MANEEQLAILRQGVAVWNRWREEHPNVKVDLYRANLQRANLIETNLQRANLIEADLEGANLYGADLAGADLRNADLQGAQIFGANLRNADLQGAVLPGAKLYGANLQNVSLEGANLEWANLEWADLQGAVLLGAQLQGADLTGVELQGADLTGVALYEVNLREAHLSGANMREARIGRTLFADVDLRAVQNLEYVKHDGPSTIGIDTLSRSQGQIPEVFLRGCGVPDSMIEYARSLVAAQRPIDYYSVFISYSSHDEAIAQRLHADLQAQGVRCWFVPHDLEIGVPIVRGIDEAIRIYDKLLIILSEAAVASRWVEFEVSTALHREIEQGRTLRFPIRLDDTVLHTPSGWAAQLRTRHIGDFRTWKDHDRYQAAFARLLRDLKVKDQAGT